MSEEDQDRTLDLLDRLYAADWRVSSTARTTQGVTVTFRKHFTSDVPGMETRQTHGHNANDAIVKLLAELEKEGTG